MIVDDEVKKRMDEEKYLFDYARMYVTVFSWIGIIAVVWNIRDRVDPFTAIVYYPSLVVMCGFVGFLAFRFHEMNEGIAAIWGAKARASGRLLLQFGAWVLGLSAVGIAISLATVLGAIVEGFNGS